MKKIIYNSSDLNISQKTLKESSYTELFLFSIIKEYHLKLSETLKEKKIEFRNLFCSIEDKSNFIEINVFIDTDSEIKILEEILDHSFEKCAIISIVKHGKIIEYGLKFDENEL